MMMMKRRCDCDSSILGSVVGPLPTLLFPPHPHGFSLSFIYYICFSIFVLFIFIHSPLLQPTYNPAFPSLLFYTTIKNSLSWFRKETFILWWNKNCLIASKLYLFDIIIIRKWEQFFIIPLVFNWLRSWYIKLYNFTLVSCFTIIQVLISLFRSENSVNQQHK